jgi:hypothetical protein
MSERDYVAGLRRDIDTLRAQLFAATAKANELRRGNTILLDALADMVNQHFFHANGGPEVGEFLTDNGLSANENAIAVLLDAGMARQIRDDRCWYVIDWDALKERMETPSSEGSSTELTNHTVK